MATNKKARLKEVAESYRKLTMVEDDVDDETLKSAFSAAENGTRMRIVKLKSLRSPATLKLSQDHQFLIYERSGRKSCYPGGGESKQVPISMLVDVRKGWNTDRFMKAASKDEFSSKVPEACCFSVVYRKLHRLQKTVDFVTATPEEQTAWVIVLRRLLDDIRAAALHFNEKTWLENNFREADVNNNGRLSFRELWELLKKLSVQITESECRRQFTLSDFRKSDNLEAPSLDFEEFVLFFRSLTRRPELKSIMRSYSDFGIDLWTANDLRRFLETSQGFEVTLDECSAIIQEFEPDDEVRKDGRLSVHGFRLLLLSKWGAIMKLAHVKTVFQDMTQPLCAYFIHSTHNTYLLGHQLLGDATIEGYILALKSGARMLELDIWEGKDEPVVTHGYTLVNPQTLVNVVRAIDTYAFRTSAYPLILSVENHCGIEFQQKTAHIFAKIFGDKIYVPPSSLNVLPSPGDLKNKILIKCKKLGDTKTNAQCDDDDECFDEVYDALFDDSWTPERLETPAVMKIRPGDVVLPEARILSSVQAAAKKKEKVPIAQELSDLVALKAVKLKNLELDTSEHPWNSHASLTENRGRDYCEKEYEMMLYYTSRHFMKIYPSGKRASSTNYHPTHFWTAGIQNVTMNAQTAGEQMDLNHGLFAINKECGYVLKPMWMRNPESVRYVDLANQNAKMVLRVQVISAQCLPRPDTKYTDAIVDPYVTLEIFGFPFDDHKYKTSVVKSNGFNPIWNSEHFVFNLKVPEMALLRFCVKDYDRLSANDFIGQYTIPVISITPGYSNIPLLTGTAHTSDPSAALFVHIDMECSLSEEELCSIK